MSASRYNAYKKPRDRVKYNKSDYTNFIILV